MKQENNLTSERTAILKKMLLKKLREVPIVQAACKKINVGRATYYRWKKEDKKFAEKAELAVQEGVKTVNDLAEYSIISAISNKDMAAAKFWLKHRHEAYKTRVEVTEKSDEKRELTGEQEEAVRRALQLAGLITVRNKSDARKGKPRPRQSFNRRQKRKSRNN